MLIDAHTHILSLAEDAGFTTEYGREGSLCIYRSLGKLPAHRAPTEQEWESSGYSRRGFPVIGPLYDPVELRAKLLSVNDQAERVGSAPIPQAKLDGIGGDNYARMLGLLS